MPSPEPNPPPPKSGSRPRVVLLGASNVTRGVSIVVETARLRLGGPIDVLAAIGHGRSYGTWSRVLGRSLPGIIQCNMWNALEQWGSEDRPIHALLTDVGNDVLYGAPVDTIIGWIEQCLDRLDAARASIIVTLLPIEGIRELPRWRFRIVRTILFPAHRLPYEVVIGRAVELNERLTDLAISRGLAPVTMDPAWYGLDPIHIRIRHVPGAWARILGGWTGNAASESSEIVARRSVRRWAALRSAFPDSHRIMGIARQIKQPAATLADGTTVSLY